MGGWRWRLCASPTAAADPYGDVCGWGPASSGCFFLYGLITGAPAAARYRTTAVAAANGWGVPPAVAWFPLLYGSGAAAGPVLIATRLPVTRSRARPRHGGAGGNSRRPAGWSPTYAVSPLSPAPCVSPPALPLLGWRCSSVHGRSGWRWPRSGGGAPRGGRTQRPGRWSARRAATAGGTARPFFVGLGEVGRRATFTSRLPLAPSPSLSATQGRPRTHSHASCLPDGGGAA